MNDFGLTDVNAAAQPCQRIGSLELGFLILVIASCVKVMIFQYINDLTVKAGFAKPFRLPALADVFSHGVKPRLL